MSIGKISLRPSFFWGIKFLWPTVFLLPFALWQYTSDVIGYYRYGAPVGQIWYVCSKLFGLYAVLLLWYQALSTLLKDTHYAVALPQWTFLHHRLLGSLTLVAIILHAVFFVTAVSLRKETVAWEFLLPDFRDFYHSAITLGLFGVMLALLAVTAAIVRKSLPTFWKSVHRCMIIVAIIGLVHGYLIGTETRYGLYELFYCSLLVSLLVAVYARWYLFKEK